MFDEIIWVHSTNRSPTSTQLKHLTVQFHVYHYLSEMSFLLALDVSAICQWLFWWTFPRSLELVLLPTYAGRTKTSWTTSKSFFGRLTKVSTSYVWLNLSIANKRSTKLRTSLRLEMGFSRRHEEFIDILSRLVSLEWCFALIIIREDDVFNPILLFEVSDMETPVSLSWKLFVKMIEDDVDVFCATQSLENPRKRSVRMKMKEAKSMSARSQVMQSTLQLLASWVSIRNGRSEIHLSDSID